MFLIKKNSRILIIGFFTVLTFLLALVILPVSALALDNPQGRARAATSSLKRNPDMSPPKNMAQSLPAGGGTFTDSALITPDCTPVPISIGQTVSGALTEEDCYDFDDPYRWYLKYYSFSAAAGQQVAFEMTSADFDTCLILYELVDNNMLIMLTYDDDGGDGENSRIPPGSGFITLPSAGVYIISATTWFSEYTGNYTLSLIEPQPTLQTAPASNITSDSAILNGDIISTGASNCDQRKFQYRQQGAATWTDAGTESGSFEVGEFSCILTCLSAATTYEFKALARNSAGWGEGPALNFTTSVASEPELIGDFNRDGKIDFEELMLFSLAWGHKSEDNGWGQEAAGIPGSPFSQCDIGPATGSPPHFSINPDGKIDFEDLMIFAAMWNWFESSIPSPVITIIDPAGGPPGTAVTISGSGFGALQGAGAVTFNGVTAAIQTWSDSLIVAVVPPGASTGNIIVTVSGRPSNEIPFTIKTGSGDETVLDSKTENIGPAGGIIALGDGASFTVEPGALSADTALTFNKVGHERNFSGEYWLAYEILGTAEFLPGSMIVPVQPGLEAGNIGILRYNPDTLEGDTPPFEYDDQTGAITVNMPASAQMSPVAFESQADVSGQAQGEPFPGYRTIVEVGKLATQVYNEKTIKMPFYEQIGGTCWAADTVMLSKAFTPYTNREKEIEIYDYLKCMGLGIDDGIGTNAFKHSLNHCFHTATSAGVSTYSWIVADNLRDFMRQELDKGYPLILRYPGHTLLVTGYKHYQHGIRNMTDFLVHDSKGINPPNASEGTMCTWRNYQDWLVSRLLPAPSLITINSLLWSHDAVPHPERALQTIGLPSMNNIGMLSFRYTNEKGSAANVMLGFSESETKGYAWYIGSDTRVDAIPYRAEQLRLKLPLWNADLDSDAAVQVEVKVLQGENTRYSHSDNITLGTDRNAGWFTKDIPVCDFRGTGGASYTLQVKLYNAGVYQDGFSVDFVMEDGPVICSINPAAASPSTEVTISGFGFGAAQGASSLKFNNAAPPGGTTILSWSNNIIQARVPWGTDTGTVKVKVTVEGKESNSADFEVTPSDLVFPMEFPVLITYVSGVNPPGDVETWVNKKGKILIYTYTHQSGATVLGLNILLKNDYGGFDLGWAYTTHTQDTVYETPGFLTQYYHHDYSVNAYSTGFTASFDNDNSYVYNNYPTVSYTQWSRVNGTINKNGASGTIGWRGRTGPFDEESIHNYSFIPDI